MLSSASKLGKTVSDVSSSTDEDAEDALSITHVFSLKTTTTHQGQPRAPTNRAAQKGSGPSIAVLAYDPLCQRVYFGLDNGDLCFWPLLASGVGGNSRYVGCHKGRISALNIPRKDESELGAVGLFLSASVDSTIKIWDYKGRVTMDPAVCVQTLYGHDGTVTAVVSRRNIVLSGSTDRTIRVWRKVEGRAQLVYPWFELQTIVVTLDGWVRSMSYDTTDTVGDVGVLYAADDTGRIIKVVPVPLYDEEKKRWSDRYEFRVEGHVLESPGGLPLAFRRVHDRSVSLLRFVGKWDMVITLAYDNCLRVYDGTTRNLKHCWENEHHVQFTGLEVDMAQHEVLTVDALGYMAIYNTRSGNLVATKQLSKEPLSAMLQLSPSRYGVALAREVAVWHVEHELDYDVLRGGHEREVLALYSCSGGLGAVETDFRILSAALDRTVRLWDPYNLSCIRVLEETVSDISAMVFFEAWNILVTGHDNGDVRLWNLDTAKTVTLRQHSNSVSALTLGVFHKNEELLISGGFDGWVVIWDIRSLASRGPPHMLTRFQAHGVEGATPMGKDGLPVPGCEPEILCVKHDVIKKVIITSGNDRVIKVWSSSNNMYLGRHIGHTDSVTCLALDANFLFSGSEDCTVRLWDTVPSAPANVKAQAALSGFSTQALKVLTGHTRAVTGLELMAGSGRLVSCSLDGTLRFWDYVTGEVLLQYAHETEEFRCLALRFDKPEVLVGTTQGSILRYSTVDASATSTEDVPGHAAV